MVPSARNVGDLDRGRGGHAEQRKGHPLVGLAVVDVGGHVPGGAFLGRDAGPEPRVIRLFADNLPGGSGPLCAPVVAAAAPLPLSSPWVGPSW